MASPRGLSTAAACPHAAIAAGSGSSRTPPHGPVAASEYSRVRVDACASCRPSRSSAQSCVPPVRLAAAVSFCRSRRAPAVGSGIPPVALRSCPPSGAVPLVFFRNVGTHFVTLHPLQDRAAVVTLVPYHLFDSLDVDLGLTLRSLLRGFAFH